MNENINGEVRLELSLYHRLLLYVAFPNIEIHFQDSEGKEWAPYETVSPLIMSLRE